MMPRKKIVRKIAFLFAFISFVAASLSACAGTFKEDGIIGEAAYYPSEETTENAISKLPDDTDVPDGVIDEAVSITSDEAAADEALATNSDAASMALHVEGSKLKDAAGNVVQLRGVSTHGIGKYPDYVNEDAFRTLRDDWNANVVRIAMYTEEDGGYCTNGDKEALKALVRKGVDAATDLGMYVIIDWHILSDGDPNWHKGDAIAFFDEMSEQYSDHDNVIYEICNEPNGAPWQSAIRPYAEELIAVIRDNSPDAVILVGTNTWSQDIDQVMSSPLDEPNVMYVCHFYAATHKESLRARVNAAVSAGIPIFISECSICEASGSGSIDYGSAEAWMSLINENSISYVEWNLSNKAASSAIVQPDCTKLSGWSEDELTDTAGWFRAKMKESR